MKIILASKSPRRREILQNLGIEFEIITADTDESSEIREPSELVSCLALRKGEAVARAIENDAENVEKERILVISSDTLVAVDGEILGKPSDLSDAKRMLRKIKGRAHSVYSGIAITELVDGKINKSFASAERTDVYFADMSDGEIELYVNTEKVLDKAGAYAIQGVASAWIEKIDGDYFNVVGLPVRRLFKVLSEEFSVKPEDLIKRLN